MKIAILIPTIYRPDGLRRSLQSLKDTTNHLSLLHDIHAIVAAEDDDVDALTIAHEFRATFTTCEKRHQGPGYAWNTALKAALDYDAYFTGSDDVEFMHGWLDEVLLILNESLHGSGLVGINDGRWKREMVYKMCATHYLMTRDFIIEHMGGVVAQECYHADFTDMEANARARRAGKWAWAEKAIVKHHWNGPHGDLGYENATKQRPRMKPLYEKRKEMGFPDDFERILS